MNIPPNISVQITLSYNKSENKGVKGSLYVSHSLMKTDKKYIYLYVEKGITEN